MIDLETLGIQAGCPVISIGAVFFDVDSKQLGPSFYGVLDLTKQIKDGRKVDGDTIKWWMQQDGAAKKLFSDTAKEPVFVLNTFLRWVQTATTTKTSMVNVWGNGATFDITILEEFMKFYNVGTFWKYSNVMDLRTFRRFVAKGKKIENAGVKHNALDDAIAQAQFVIDNVHS
jgi:hypothetical protein